MQGVPIKFRGYRIDGNGYAYGDLVHDGEEIRIGGYPVEAWGICQLCGYDAAGNEIYEGDPLVSVYDRDDYYTASMKSFAQSSGDFVPLEFAGEDMPRPMLKRWSD